jgi:hypothetical protein
MGALMDVKVRHWGKQFALYTGCSGCLSCGDGNGVGEAEARDGVSCICVDEGQWLSVSHRKEEWLDLGCRSDWW